MEDDGNFLAQFDAFDVTSLVSDQFDDQPMEQQSLGQQQMVDNSLMEPSVIEQHQYQDFPAPSQQVFQQQPTQVLAHVVQQMPQQQHRLSAQLLQQPVQQIVQQQPQLQQVVLPQQQNVVVTGTVMSVNGQQYVMPSTTISTVGTVPVVTHQPASHQQAIVVTSSAPETTRTTATKRRTAIVLKTLPTPSTPEPETPPKAKGRRAAPTAKGTATKGRKKKDPNAPSPAHSAYKFFYMEAAQNVKNHNPAAKFGDVSGIVAGMWESMSDQEKVKYRTKALEDKTRYAKELEEYTNKEEQEQSETTQETSVVFTSTATTPSVVRVTTNARIDPADITTNTCIREGCGNMAVRNLGWEDEYCSNECVVQHCKIVFETFTETARSHVAEMAA